MQLVVDDVADTVTFVAMPDDRAEIAQLARNFRALRDVELALHVPASATRSRRS